jgi:hypothetical protein
MQAMNYCRQMTPTFEHAIRVLAENTDEKSIALRDEYMSALKMAQAANKFTLPTGGRVIVDYELRGLGNMELRLPFRTVALEYPVASDGRMQKHVVLAEEQDDRIVMQYVIGFEGDDWIPAGRVHMPRTNYAKDCGGYFYPEILVEDTECPEDFALAPAIALLSFLNALACSNVHIDKLPARKTNKKRRGLAFDEYHVLMIDVPGHANGHRCLGVESGRSPREHLRRGHIRRLQSGARIWVNAAVVNAGKGLRGVSKDYAVRAPSNAKVTGASPTDASK